MNKKTRGEFWENRNLISFIGIGVATLAIMLLLCWTAGENRPVSKNVDSGTAVFALMYHQMLKDESSQGRYVVAPYEFEEDLKFLSSNGFTAMLPSELAQAVESGEGLPEKPVLITLDDGYETGLSYVLPLLKKYDMKAEINIVGTYSEEYSGYSENEKSLSYAYLTWEEIRELAESGRVEIGNHTYNMHGNGWIRSGCMQRQGESDFEYKQALKSDLEQLQCVLWEKSGVLPVTFAYPYGLICDNSLEVMEELDFKVLLTCRELLTNVKYYQETPIVINRFNREHNLSAAQLYAKAIAQ